VTDVETGALPTAQRLTPKAVQVDAVGLSKTVRGGKSVLNDVSLTVRSGQLVAIVGGSGAGKTMLLEALAGVRPAERGLVLFDGVDLYANLGSFRTLLGYVPQDDIIHAELPLEQTLRYAAMLRLPGSVSKQEIDGAVGQVMDSLDLTARARVRVGSLSGGQRKRASIAVELLTNPQVFFLDEPTSGLDPASGAELLSVLRNLADGGSTVVFTTHAVQDLARADAVAFLAQDGHLAFFGAHQDALRYFEVERVEQIYERVAREGTPEVWASRFVEHRAMIDATVAAPAPSAAPVPRARAGSSFLRQWSVLTRRTFETITRNRLTLAILLGSPVLVVAMLGILFRSGAFDFADPSPIAAGMLLFWLTFAAFFFGLTYGLLQVVTEQAILRREHLVGQRLSAYLLSKITVLLPFLLLIVVLMLVVLRMLGRLPPEPPEIYVSICVTLALLGVGALTLGLLTSAAVSNPAQATLALPMLCFPAVLFSGAILPVHQMVTIGAAISAIVPDRWAWEALGHDIGMRHLFAHGGSSLGPPLLRAYGDAGTLATGTYWLFLGSFVVVFTVGAWATLVRKCRRATR
jgi:ABC-type multidrug transport system ATPase subunit